MKRSLKEHYRALLVDKREDLYDRVRSALSNDQDDSAKDAPDPGDRAITSISRDLLFQLSGTERDILKRIDVALDRLDKDTYGTCLNCSEVVPPERLEAVPWARHCINCQELHDRGEL